MKHTAIYNTHTNVVTIRENEDGNAIAYDENEDVVELDQALIDIETGLLQAEYDSHQYARDRNYAPTGDQLDMLWHSIDAGEFGDTAKQSEFYTANKAVKDAFPKG